MAKVMTVEVPTWRQWMVVMALGVAMGLLYAILVWLLSKYVVGPLACGAGSTAQCSASIFASSNVATVLVALAGTIAGVRLNIARPLLVSVGVAAVLWGLGEWIFGLHWLEVAGWSILIYSLAYLLFVWVSRHNLLLVSVITTIVIVLVERIILAL